MTPPPTVRRWEVGKVLGPRGLRGELKLRLFRASPTYLAAGRIYLGDEIYTVRRLAWADSTTPVVQLDGVADRTAAEALINAPLGLDPAWFEPGEGPIEELLGARAIDDTTGAPLGLTVAGIGTNGVQPLLILHTASGREQLIPYVDALVPGIDVGPDRALSVRIRAIPGLLDDAAEVAGDARAAADAGDAMGDGEPAR